MSCPCFIIPKDVFKRFAKDRKLSAAERKLFADALDFETNWRKDRERNIAYVKETQKLFARGIQPVAPPPAATAVTVYDCQNGVTLPGVPVPKPGASDDGTAKRAFVETTAVAEFYKKLFGRTSVDDAGMTLLSSVHYGVKYNNAFWDGYQMTYGDGDGNIFLDFTKSSDVIGHELTHGVTQYTAALSYTDEAGGLNESMSDVFGSMFRQWRAGQTTDKADWLIGKEIIGPAAAAKGYTCLRDMANPASRHCLAPQPMHFSQYRKGMDPHESSGIPNFAFYKAAGAVGGNSWEKVGKIWYAALADFPPQPNMKMKMFANRTRRLAKSLFANEPAVYAGIDKAWLAVGL